MRGDVVCACTTHPQSSTVIIIYSGRCPHNKLHGSYIFITMVRAKFSYVPCFIIVKKLKLLEPRSLAGTHVFSKGIFGKSKSAGWWGQAGMSGIWLSANFSLPTAVPLEGSAYIHKNVNVRAAVIYKSSVRALYISITSYITCNKMAAANG